MTYIIINPRCLRDKPETAMLASTFASALSRRGVHYGWIVIATTFFSALVMAGAVGLPGAFILPLSKEFGWDTAQISTAMAVRFALFGLMDHSRRRSSKNTARGASWFRRRR